MNIMVISRIFQTNNLSESIKIAISKTKKRNSFKSHVILLFFLLLKAEITNLLRSNKELATGLNQLKEHVSKKLKNNTYGVVNLTDLFKRV